MSKLISIGDLAYIGSYFLPLSWLFLLARWNGRLRYWTSRHKRETVQENLRALPGPAASDGEIRRQARLFFEYKELRILLYYLYPRLTPSQLDTLLPIEGAEHLQNLRTGKQGGILLLSHLNSTLGFTAKEILRARGYDVRVAFPTDTLPFQPTTLRKSWNRVFPPRNPVGGADFYAQFNIRPIVKRIQEGATILLTGDGWHSAGLVKARFLEREVYFTTGAVGISRAAGCPIVPLFVVGYPPDKLRIVIEEPLPMARTDDMQRDMQVMASHYVKRLEARVRENPLAWEHWFEERALETMARLPEMSLNDRYRV